MTALNVQPQIGKQRSPNANAGYFFFRAGLLSALASAAAR